MFNELSVDSRVDASVNNLKYEINIEVASGLINNSANAKKTVYDIIFIIGFLIFFILKDFSKIKNKVIKEKIKAKYTALLCNKRIPKNVNIDGIILKTKLLGPEIIYHSVIGNKNDRA